MRKSNCKLCKEGVVLNPKCNKIVSKYYCDIDAYDRETGCANCLYKKESEVTKKTFGRYAPVSISPNKNKYSEHEKKSEISH